MNPPTTPTTEYKCKLCNKSFKTEAELREHEKICKGSSGQKKP
jgi:Zinc-finger double-stranded RNA-binding